MSILDYVPFGWTLRPEQEKLLLEVEKSLPVNDAVFITAPTAVGKTLIGYTIASWASNRFGKVRILEPNNILVDQANAAFPQVPVLHKKDFYPCESTEHEIECSCQHKFAVRQAKEARVSLMNYWTYMANRLYSPVVIFDEGHTTIDMLRGLQSIKLWQSEYSFPNDLKYVADLVDWGMTYLKKRNDEKLDDAIKKLMLVHPKSHVIYNRTKSFRKHKDLLLSVEPSTVEYSTQFLWPHKTVKKMVFMSATTGPQDVRELGLNRRRIAYLTCPSPIPVKNRPLIYKPSYNLSHKVVDKAIPYVVMEINKLMEKYPSKGLIHFPYSLALKLQEHLDDKRFMFHTKSNKKKMLKLFKESDPKEGRVLLASGLYEGVDLPYDCARWQLIGKVPFLSLGDPWVKVKAEEDPEWYHWSTIKLLIQAYGRIVRAVDDQGTTIILDNSFGKLVDLQKKMFPQFLLDAIIKE
jgi:Rad3-related DNA helicase